MHLGSVSVSKNVTVTYLETPKVTLVPNESVGLFVIVSASHVLVLGVSCSAHVSVVIGTLSKGHTTAISRF